MNVQRERPLSRRTFLQGAAAGATAVIAGTTLGQPPAQALTDEPTPDAWGVLIDLTRCTGCNSCALACKEANNRPEPEVAPTRLDSDALTFVDVRQSRISDVEWRSTYVKRQCMHCLHPACVSACTVGALRKTPEGPVVYDDEKCIGCRYCQYACPFGVPAYDWDNPLGLIHKCEMCVSRLAEGKAPACVQACPAGALRFDRRANLLAQARAQIDSNPGRYVDHIYGEHEAGGTSMLYLSAVPFAELGFPQLGPEPNARYAESVMQATPIVALSVASLATVLHWLLKRRELNMAETHVVPPPDQERPQ